MYICNYMIRLITQNMEFPGCSHILHVSLYVSLKCSYLAYKLQKIKENSACKYEKACLLELSAFIQWSSYKNGFRKCHYDFVHYIKPC